ncbi:hypothetical protein [Pedobacter hartonius]|uniref:Uncharacterized protein n=1 Tax=Pedobacter hartonius TaxID=425514 RepID=A0A1H4BVG5_9SPHI|nr:hypothetical protein [Pedobacter hartonius]SEA52079.1 hypothetical protein SAMN05443550_103482 [Pedobacter hartonius]
MEPTNKIAEIIKSEILALQSSVAVKQNEMESAYKEAIQQANKVRKESQKDVDNDLKTMESLSAALVALGVKTEKPKSTAKQHPLLVVPAEYHANLTLNEKISFVLNEAEKEYSKEDIAEVIAVYDDTDATKVATQIGGVLSSLKSKGLLIANKDGRKDLFTLVKE